jgi:hypothetical protein
LPGTNVIPDEILTTAPLFLKKKIIIISKFIKFYQKYFFTISGTTILVIVVIARTLILIILSIISVGVRWKNDGELDVPTLFTSTPTSFAKTIFSILSNELESLRSAHITIVLTLYLASVFKHKNNSLIKIM